MTPKKEFWKIMQISGLAISLPFEIAGGPFVGYFLGVYLTGKFGAGSYLTLLFIALGIVASIINTAAIIRMMIRINREEGD